MLTWRFPAGFVPPPTPTIPAAPTALMLIAGKQKLILQWTDNSANETGFRIERSISGGAFVEIAQVGANVRSYVDSGLNKKHTYTYRVRAFNGGGNSAYSNPATGKPQ